MKWPLRSCEYRGALEREGGWWLLGLVGIETKDLLSVFGGWEVDRLARSLAWLAPLGGGGLTLQLKAISPRLFLSHSLTSSPSVLFPFWRLIATLTYLSYFCQPLDNSCEVSQWSWLTGFSYVGWESSTVRQDHLIAGLLITTDHVPIEKLFIFLFTTSFILQCH